MKKNLIISTTFLALTVAHGQTTFQKTYGGTSDDWGYSVQQTSDGGYIIGGYYDNISTSADDFYLIKTAPNGDTLWTKTFGGTSSDEAYSVQQTTDGGYVIAGGTYSFGAGAYDFYLIKTTSNGNTLWTKTFGGSLSEIIASVRQTNDGGYVIAGFTYGLGAGNTDGYLIKTDANGNTLWTKTYGGTNYDAANSVQQTTDGGYIITGFRGSLIAGDQDVYLIKTDAGGDTLWTKAFGGTKSDGGSSVQQTTDGGYIITGYTKSFGAGSDDIYLIKTDANGGALWTKTYGGTNNDDGSFVQQTMDGGYIITGNTNSFGAGFGDVYLIKTDINGGTLWTKTFGGTNVDLGYSVQQTTDGGYVITGSTRSFGAGSDDVYLIKTDANGNAGCNENTPNTIVTTPPTIIGNTTTQVSYGGIVGNPTTQTGSGGVVTTLCISTGVNEFEYETSVSVFPNPFSTQTTLQANTFFKDATLTIYNSIGQQVKQLKNISGQTVTLYRDNLPNGLYFLRLTQDNITFATNKFVITDN